MTSRERILRAMRAQPVDQVATAPRMWKFNRTYYGRHDPETHDRYADEDLQGEEVQEHQHACPGARHQGQQPGPPALLQARGAYGLLVDHHDPAGVQVQLEEVLSAVHAGEGLDGLAPAGRSARGRGGGRRAPCRAPALELQQLGYALGADPSLGALPQGALAPLAQLRPSRHPPHSLGRLPAARAILGIPGGFVKRPRGPGRSRWRPERSPRRLPEAPAAEVGEKICSGHVGIGGSRATIRVERSVQEMGIGACADGRAVV